MCVNISKDFNLGWVGFIPAEEREREPCHFAFHMCEQEYVNICKAICGSSWNVIFSPYLLCKAKNKYKNKR